MADDLPTPPVPSDCDLRAFQYMPLDVLRLRDSELAAVATGDEFRAAVLLWCASWHQLPSGSLPKEDHLLARLAGYGRDLKGWTKVRAGAMRGWSEASDGLLYHRVVSEKAAEAWRSRIDQRARTEAARAAREAAREAARAASLSRSAQPVTVSVTETVTESAARSVTESKGEGREREGKGREGNSIQSVVAAALNPGEARTPQAATAATLGDLVSPIRTDPPPPPPTQTLADFQAVHPALLVTRDDRERCATMLRLYGWGIAHQAIEALAAQKARSPVGKRRIFVGELADWLGANAVLDPEDYDRAGIPRPQARA
jgi:uncharacterized protein YdaU (DUF1376 family)